MPKQIKIVLTDVVRRFKENKGKPTSWYLGLDSPEEFRPASNKLVGQLRELGADLDWWLGTNTLTASYVNLGDEPKNGPTKKMVVTGLGFNYGIILHAADCKIKRDFAVIMGKMRSKIGPMAENLTKTLDKMGPDEREFMKREIAELPNIDVPTLIDRMKVLEEMMALKQFDPNDTPLWVVEILKLHGQDEEVALDTWFTANLLFTRVIKAETAKLAQGVFGRFKLTSFLSNKIFGRFLGK